MSCLLTLFIYFLPYFNHMNHERPNMAQKHCNHRKYNIVILMPGFFIPEDVEMRWTKVPFSLSRGSI